MFWGIGPARGVMGLRTSPSHRPSAADGKVQAFPSEKNRSIPPVRALGGFQAGAQVPEFLLTSNLIFTVMGPGQYHTST